MRTATVFDHKENSELKLVEEPVLRWTNPVSNVPDGALFLWLGPHGRPELAAQVSIAAGTKDLWLHEFQSLSTGRFSVARGDAVPGHPQIQTRRRRSRPGGIGGAASSELRFADHGLNEPGANNRSKRKRQQALFNVAR